ncbi:MAG: hypothetical protein HZB39_11030 [Planctomycetes bacterium]|nr:hypothetical protein [Planctomycetota bacterium]
MNPARLILLHAALAAACLGQDVTWEIRGSSPDRLARRTIVVGDIDGDGHHDLIALTEDICVNGNTCRLRFISGRDGATIRSAPLAVSWSHVNWISACPDVSGDGLPDYMVSYQNVMTLVNTVELRDGVNDAVLWSSTGPNADAYGNAHLCNVDLDGDGELDVLISAYAEGSNQWSLFGALRAYSRTRGLLYTIRGSPTLSGVAWCLTRLGDLDGDGCDDFVMGVQEPTGRGAQIIVSGRTGTIFRTCYGELFGDAIFWSNDNCGDLDGDGFDDFCAGSQGSSSLGVRGVVMVFSSRTGQTLRRWSTNLSGEGFGTYLSSGGVDLDGDGVPDFVTSANRELARPNVQGVVYALSGRDGSLLHRILADYTGIFTPGFGMYLVAAPPGPGERVGSIVVPEPFAYLNTCLSNRALGRIRKYTGLPRTARHLGAPCAGALSSAPISGLQSLQSAGVRATLANAPPNAAVALLVGTSTSSFLGQPLPWSLDPYGFPGCSLLVAPELAFPAVTGSAGLGTDYARFDFPLPIPVSGNGTITLAAQWLVLPSGSIIPGPPSMGGASDAITWRY